MFSQKTKPYTALIILAVISVFLIATIDRVLFQVLSSLGSSGYDLSAKVFGNRHFARFSVPVWITSVLFGLQHLGYHHFQITSASLTQVLYTTVMGLFFCNLRKATGFLWPVILLHLLTNSFTILRNLGFV